jgi:hypothetical protein
VPEIEVMHTMQLQGTAGPDGVLRLDVPVGLAGVEFEVVVVVQARALAPRGWLPGFFEQMAEGWQDEPLVRPPQGECEVREALQ